MQNSVLEHYNKINIYVFINNTGFSYRQDLKGEELKFIKQTKISLWSSETTFKTIKTRLLKSGAHITVYVKCGCYGFIYPVNPSTLTMVNDIYEVNFSASDLF